MINRHDNKVVQLRQLFENSADLYPSNIALVCGSVMLSYQELECRANQLAQYLMHQGLSTRSNVALFLERSLESYVSMLAVLKVGATYVPIDVEYPDERVNYILTDMACEFVITSSTQFARHPIHFPQSVVIDQVLDDIAAQPVTRPSLNDCDQDKICYVIYTSGSTGKPKGVKVAHQSICHYVSTASDIYQITPDDRIYQGFSLSFDASLEELWMAFANGASLIACLPKDIRAGLGLVEFLNHHQVTVFSTVPTLLAGLDGDLPDLRLLILGGEACTASLINRWRRDGLRILNTYGPTEATVIATVAECEADKPISIGKPIPGYHAMILDEHQQPVLPGHQGELCIGGKGLALGYVNLDDMTKEKFIVHPQEKTARLYRTGDLAMMNADGEIQFLGRIDDQIKLRGFRIELNEIETVMTQHPGIAQSVVTLCELERPVLVAYILINKKHPFDLESFKHYLHKKLPHYMMPALFEEVEVFPLLASGKVNRKALPLPKSTLKNDAYIEPVTPFEKAMAAVWEKEFNCPRISIEADFFYDLGGHSLLAAKIVSSLRKIEGLQSLSVLDLYNNPTIHKLAATYKTADNQQKVDKEREKNRINPVHYALCGLGQFFGCLFQYAISVWQLIAIVICYNWISRAGATSSEIMITTLLLFLGLPILSMALTIAAKWLLIGRVKPGKYKLWGWFYLRWWLVQRLEKNVFCPKHLMGSPLIIWYYRLLGAKIGKNCFIGTSSITNHDLLTIGDNTSIGYDARIKGYIVEDGWLKLGTTTIGDHCFIGGRSVVGLDTVMHDHACLDDMSMLPQYGVIPANQFYCGSPAAESIAPPHHITKQVNITDEATRTETIQYGFYHYLSLIFATVVHYGCYYPGLMLVSYFYDQSFYLLALLIGIPFGAMLYLGLSYVSIIVCKKLLMNNFKPGIYATKSMDYLRQWTIVKMLDNDAVYVMADSLYLPRFVKLLGAKLGKYVEMGEVPHLIPDLVTIKDEGFSASSVAFAWPNIYQGTIRFAASEVGCRAFLGNYTFLPLGVKVGDGGLLGCLSITPMDNRAAETHTSWLGSPAMFLPKRELFSGFSDSEKFRPTKRVYYQRLAIEFVRILAPTMLTLVGLFSILSVVYYSLSHYSLLTTMLLTPVAEMGIVIALVSLVVGLKWMILGRLKPTAKPLWDVFIRKLDLCEYMYSYFINLNFTDIVTGTPFINMLYRCLGSKIGKRVFINTAQFAEFDLITIGDEACLNDETLIDTHLYEDRIFKMSTIDIHNGCNIGIGSMVLYNTIMEENSTLGSLSLLMKGEVLPANTSWQGTPAQPITAPARHGITPRPSDVSVSDDLVLEVS